MIQTSDVISMLREVSTLTDIIGQRIYNAKVPTLDLQGLNHNPYLWIQLRNVIPYDLQNPEQGLPPMGVTWDVEAVAAAADVAEAIRLELSILNGYVGQVGTSYANLLRIDDQSDDYITRNPSDDAGVFVSPVVLTVIGG